MAEERNRVRLAFVDIARGLAVLLMLQTHAYDAWLRPELRDTEFFRWSQMIGGLPAAFFLFLMGISGALGSERARERGATSLALVKKGLGRALALLIVAYLFRIAMFLASDRPQIESIFRVDVLNCLAVSLAFQSLLDWVAQRGSRVFVAISVAAWIAMATPFVWDGGFTFGLPERAAGYLTGRVSNTSFPLFPWAAFAFAGHAVGSLIAAGERYGLEKAMNRLLAVGLVMMPLSNALDRLETMGPRYDYWMTSPNFILFKVGVLTLLVLICFHFERGRQAVGGATGRALAAIAAALTQMGRTSLFIYCVHVDIVYGSRALPTLWRSCEIGEASRNLALLTLAMLALSYVWSLLRRGARAPL